MDEKEINALFKEWCRDTNRSGGVLVGSSIKELLLWITPKIYEKGLEIGFETGIAQAEAGADY